MDKFCLAVLQLQTGMFGNKEVVKYSRLEQHKSFTTNEVSLPSMLSTCFNTGMQLCQKMPIISDQASKSGSSTYVSNLLSNLLRQQWAYEIHKTLSIKKLPECCIYCIYSGGICMESAGKITRNGWPWRPCSFQSNFHGSEIARLSMRKGLNEFPGRTWTSLEQS